MPSVRAIVSSIPLLILLTSCGPRRITPAQAQAEIQQVYDRQNAGFASKDINETFYHQGGTVTDIHGKTTSVTLAAQSFGGTFYHGTDLHAKTIIVSATFTAKAATVKEVTRQSYSLTNTTSNLQAGLPDKFEDNAMSIDTWILTSSDGWWLTSTKVIGERHYRDGQPFDPDNP